jgi:hypothetical protein
VSFVAPLWLAVAGAIGVGVVVAHLFSTDVPPRDVLPTVRFVPEGAPMAVLRTRRLTDLFLLLLRLLAVALLGFALAGAHVKRDGPRRVVVADLSRAVGAMQHVRDSVRALAVDGSVIVAIDSVAGRVTQDSLDRRAVPSPGRGSLSAGIAAAHRALSPDRRAGAELLIVSPVVREQVDSATRRLLAFWDGPIRVVRVSAAPSRSLPGWEVRAVADDPVAAALGEDAPRGPAERPIGARLVRTLPTHMDSLWARDSGGALVLWPGESGGEPLERRAVADSQFGVAAGKAVVIETFLRQLQPRAGTVLARWMDGAPAASERPLGRGCVREVAIPVDPVGDVALRESFRAVARSFVEPCGGAPDLQLADLTALLPAPDEATADTDVRARNGPSVSQSVEARESIWFAVTALAALLAEQLLRRRNARATAA